MNPHIYSEIDRLRTAELEGAARRHHQVPAARRSRMRSRIARVRLRRA